MRSLEPFSCPAEDVSPTVMNELTPLAQKELVRLARSEIKRCAHFKLRGNRFKNSATTCASLDGSTCDAAGDFFLFEGTSTRVPAGKALTEAHFAKEIFDRERPVIIQWDDSASIRRRRNSRFCPRCRTGSSSLATTT